MLNVYIIFNENMGCHFNLVADFKLSRRLSAVCAYVVPNMYILDFRRGIAFPAKTVPAIDSEPIFAMDLFFNFMRNGSEVKKL